MFGISLTEVLVIATIALVVVGPQKLPGMLRTLGHWVRKLRRLTTEVRAQTGIDEILREEGIDGVRELRSLLRGEIAMAKQHQKSRQAEEPYTNLDVDPSREYPVEGPDAYHAVPDDLFDANAEPDAVPVDQPSQEDGPPSPSVPALGAIAPEPTSKSS